MEELGLCLCLCLYRLRDGGWDDVLGGVVELTLMSELKGVVERYNDVATDTYPFDVE